MYQLNLKPTHKPIVEFYEAINNFTSLGVKREGSVRPPFAVLLEIRRKTGQMESRPAIPKEIERQIYPHRRSGCRSMGTAARLLGSKRRKTIFAKR